MLNSLPASYPGCGGGLNPFAYQPQEFVPQTSVEGIQVPDKSQVPN